MVAKRITSCLIAVASASLLLSAQTRISLQQAASRQAQTYAPAYDGQRVIVQGVVAAPMVRVRDYNHLVIQDETGHGLTLEGTDDLLGGVRPGDRLELEGEIHNSAGLPVLLPAEIRKIGSTTPPEPKRIRVAELNSFDYLGTYVEVESYIITVGENAGGDVILLGGPREVPARVFMPRDVKAPRALNEINPGDRVRVRGFGSQYCPNPPYNRSFQLMTGSPSAFTVLSRGWIVSPGMILTGLGIMLISLLLWWAREKMMSRQRTRLRALTVLAEEVIAAANPGEISRRLNAVLPGVLEAGEVDLYLLNNASAALDRVPTSRRPVLFSIPTQSALGPFGAVIALCFRNRSQLHLPQVNKSPLLQKQPHEELPKSALLVPMFAQREVLGVLAIAFDRPRRRLSPDEQGTVQHLANQIATSLKLQEQQSMREQLLRSEKMAAAGQLISGVANELKLPLGAINRMANQLLLERRFPSAENELREIAFEAHRGSEIVSRLVSFANADQSETKPLNLIVLLTSLLEFREREWAAKGLQVKDDLPRVALMVLGNRSQLEQSILNLLVHAEQEAANARDRVITVGSRGTDKRFTITIDYPAGDPGRPDPLEEESSGILGLQVSRGIIQSHGGEIRFEHDPAGKNRFEIELPLYEHSQAGTPVFSKFPVRLLTVLLVEPDPAALRKLLGVLSSRGHRAVPVNNAEEAIELAPRLRFDVAFCSVRLPGLNWVEFFEKVRREIGSFVLLTEGYDGDITRAFKGSDGYLLSKPINETELQKLLSTIEERQETLSGNVR